MRLRKAHIVKIFPKPTLFVGLASPALGKTLLGKLKIPPRGVRRLMVYSVTQKKTASLWINLSFTMKTRKTKQNKEEPPPSPPPLLFIAPTRPDPCHGRGCLPPVSFSKTQPFSHSTGVPQPLRLRRSLVSIGISISWESPMHILSKTFFVGHLTHRSVLIILATKL